MTLKKLSVENIKDIIGKKIIVVEESMSYFNEILECLPVDIDQISFVVDDYVRNQGSIELMGRTIDVKPMQVLQTMGSDYVIVITSDYYLEIYDKICSMRDSVGNNIIYYFADRETEIESLYRERYAKEKLRDIIVFRSGPHSSQYVYGCDFADNARAMFEYLLLNGYTRKYELVWIVKEPLAMRKYFLQCYAERMIAAKNKGIYINLDKVTFVSFDWTVTDDVIHRDEYYRVLCLAKILFCTDAYGFMRNCRPDQVRVQLWHGCGFKTRTNFVSCEKRYEFNTVIGKRYKKIHANIYGLCDNQVIVTGNAKDDWLFIDDWKEKYIHLGIPTDKKVIFWLPTFRTAGEKMKNLCEGALRSELGLPVVNNDEQIAIINDVLIENNLFMVIKLHPFQDKAKLQVANLSNIMILDNDKLFNIGIQINELLAGAYALISDYSSVAIDFLLLDRPIGFLLDDIDAYAESRGFVFANIAEWLPGREIYQFEDYIRYLQELGNGQDLDKEKREDIRCKLYDYFDGNSCMRILQAFIE